MPSPGCGDVGAAGAVPVFLVASGIRGHESRRGNRARALKDTKTTRVLMLTEQRVLASCSRREARHTGNFPRETITTNVSGGGVDRNAT